LPSILFLVLRALVIALEAPTLFSRLLAGAVAMIFFSYAFVNMGMVSGILPVVGVPLPFISYGGTAMLTLGLGLGILMSIGQVQAALWLPGCCRTGLAGACLTDLDRGPVRCAEAPALGASVHATPAQAAAALGEGGLHGGGRGGCRRNAVRSDVGPQRHRRW
jgi:hypothetical protein